MKLLVCLALTSLGLWGQDEASLRRFFEGRQVRVKIDMPATHEGIDYHWRSEPALDFKAYSTRIRRFGVALRNGDEVMITTLRVKAKNIEFQLGGGGYGVFGDETGYVAASSVPKSNREKQLERDIDRETDSRRRDHMRSELNRLRDARLREDRYRREEARRLSEMKQAEVDQKRPQAGSRFNLWFPEGYLKERVPTPREVMEMLSEWVDFRRLR